MKANASFSGKIAISYQCECCVLLFAVFMLVTLDLISVSIFIFFLLLFELQTLDFGRVKCQKGQLLQII